MTKPTIIFILTILSMTMLQEGGVWIFPGIMYLLATIGLLIAPPFEEINKTRKRNNNEKKRNM
jgi:hypothetical protein